MKKNTRNIARFLLSLLLSAELCFPADALITVLWKSMPAAVFILAFAAVTLAFFLLKKLTAKRLLSVFVIVALIYVLLLGSAGLIWFRFFRSSAYNDPDVGKAALFSDKKVMLIVPHQDDDLNILGGVIQQYEKYGSEVYAVFSTTGDYSGIGERRMAEAIDVMKACGTDEEHVIFLGWGNEWQEGHIYNAPAEEVRTSHAGHTANYGLPTHPAYRDGESYTRDNMVGDLESVILEYRPEVIFCIDYDYHVDHAALSFLFEEAMGNVLRRTEDYTPTVLKGLAYTLAYYGVDDFYETNIRSTVNSSPVPYLYERPDYRWDARVRLPVDASSLSRSLLASGQFKSLRQYKTQTAWLHAVSVINGDKCFWYRPTSSLCYQADIRVSSGDGSLLNNFKLLDSEDVMDFGRMPYDDTWVTAPGDSERSAEVCFPAPVSLSQIRLYDDPDAFDNVLSTEIVFDDGSRIKTGPLEYQGAPTVFDFEPKTVSSFMVRVLESEGEGAGITEIEAYSAVPDTGLRYIKLMNGSGDFVYDYRIDRSGYEEFGLYVSGAPVLSTDVYTVSCDGEGCAAEIRDGRLTLVCPRGKDCVVRVSTADGELSDRVYFSNPSPLKGLGQKLEDFAWHNYSTLHGCCAYRLLRFAYHLVSSENIVL